jgi:hypothetical protein
MELLSINLTKDLGLLHAIHIPFYTALFFGIKNPDKKIRETRKLESIHE